MISDENLPSQYKKKKQIHLKPIKPSRGNIKKWTFKMAFTMERQTPIFEQVTPSRSSGKNSGPDRPPPGLKRYKKCQVMLWPVLLAPKVLLKDR